MTDKTLMRQEIEEIPAAVERLLAAEAVPEVARAVAARDPAFFVTVARGSSDHACTFFKYAAELVLGRVAASVGPSVASVYGAPLRLGGAVSLSVSQSGGSPDIVAMTRAARVGGALTVALTNTPGSPLADAAEHVVDIRAGPERSVAATKSFVTSALAALWLVAEVAQDPGLLKAIRGLPEALSRAVEADWRDAAEAMDEGGSVYVLGRGPGWAMAQEAALKFKECCQTHAEAYSSAEVLHGPVSIVGRGFPVLAFACGDAAEQGVAEMADRLARQGAGVFATTPLAQAARVLEVPRTGHGLTDPLALIVAFYAMAERVARARGLDPDAPPHLRKVTETL
ncbi:SIS domain-containing protein [Vannielia litorea]|uniref:Glutamine--fructose-6-phosphate transaminase n=1 Tax=Vannielia litorea TaxID=1217970 RepID=A0A1N6FQL9_9RHOB|nr:SIS domain-containing protein [Vannielia litorea]SIN97564.1 glutamine--fructose-6-phosphate transaminase [Vannielia litorea]